MAGVPVVGTIVSSDSFSVLCTSSSAVRTTRSGIKGLFKRGCPSKFASTRISCPVSGSGRLTVVGCASNAADTPGKMVLHCRYLSTGIRFNRRGVPSAGGSSVISVLPVTRVCKVVFRLVCPVYKKAPVCCLNGAPAPTLLLNTVTRVEPFRIVAIPLIVRGVFGDGITPIIGGPIVGILTTVPKIGRLVFGGVHATLLNTFKKGVRRFVVKNTTLGPRIRG